MTKYFANIVTGCRILGSVLLLFFSAFSLEFYVIYIFCGFSDMVDGTIARKTNSATEFGSKLDTVADLLFIIASFIKILPMINAPIWLWVWGVLIATVKFANIIFGYISKKEFISVHTIINKIAGLLLFVLPLTLSFIDLKYSSIVVCSVITFAAIQESFYIAINRENK